MAKRVNKNMVAALTAFGFVIMTVVGVLMILQLRDVDPERFVALATEQEDKENWPEARLYYQKAYSVSKDEKYLVDVGRMFYSAGDEGRAQQAWQAALTQDPSLAPALEKLLDYYYELATRFSSLARWRQVRDTAEALLEQRDQDPFGLLCRGRALIVLRDEDPANLDEGFQALRRAVEIAPENVEYGLALAVAEAREDRTQVSEDHFRRLIEACTTPGKDASKIRGIYARFLSTQSARAEAAGDPEQARELEGQAMAFFNEAISLAGDDPEDQAAARVYLAQHLLGRKLAPALNDPEQESQADQIAEQAKTLLIEAKDIDPDGFEHYLLLVELHRMLGRHTEAIQVCEQRLKRDIDRRGIKGVERKRGLFRLLIQAADECVSAAIGLPGDSSQRAELLDKGQQFVSDARAEVPTNPQAIHTEAKIQLTRGNDQEALRLFEEADREYSSPNSQNKQFLAELYLIRGEVGAARDAIEVAVQGPRTSTRTWLTYARVLMRANDPRRATEAAQRVLQRDPGNRDALLLLADGFRKLGRHDLMREVIEQLGEGGEDNEIIRARALAAEERYEEALAVLTPALEADPTDRDVVAQLADLHRKLGHPEQAKAVVARALAADPEAMHFKKLELALEEDLTPKERYERYLALISSIEDQYERALELARYHSERGEWDEAEAELAQAERLLSDRATPKTLEATRRYGGAALRDIVDRRFRIACGRENWAQAEQIAARAAETDLDGVDGLTFYGRLQLKRDQHELAADTLRQVVEKQPNNSRILVLLGQAYLNLDRFDLAQEAFEKAVVVNPNHGFAQKGLALLARKRKDAVAYQKHFAECVRLIPNDPWVKQEYEGLEAVRDPEAAIATLLTQREENPEDLDTVLRLGALYLRTDKKPQAQECYEAALKLAPDSLTVAHTAAGFYRQLGDNARAQEILESLSTAFEEAPQQAAAQLLLATHFVETGELERADAAFLAAADKHPGLEICLQVGRHFFMTERPAKAADWLEKAAATAAEKGDPRVRGIENMRIEALVKMQAYDRAIEAIERHLERFPEPGNVALTLRAEIEAARGETAKAIKTLSQFLEGSPGHALATLRRARYQTRLGKWGLAINDLELIKAKYPEALDLDPRKMLARAYERTGRFEQAVAELETLLSEHPNDSSVANRMVRMYVKHKAFDRANRVIQFMLTRDRQSAYWVYQRGRVAAERAKAEEEDSPAKQTYITAALKDLGKAAEMAGFDPGIVGPMMTAYRDFEQYDAGIEFYEKKLAPAQRHPIVTKSYAGLLAKKGLTAKSVEHYRMATQTGRAAGGALFVQAIVGDAVEVFGGDRAVELFRSPPGDERLVRTNQTLLAATLSLVGQPSEAATLFDQLLSTVQDDAEKGTLLLLSATAADQANDPQRAKLLYEQVIELEPTNWAALNNLAYLLCDRLKQCEEALPYAAQAVALNDAPTIEDTLGTALTGVGRFREAVGRLGQTIQTDPDFVPGYVHLADAYRRLGEFEQAEGLVEEAQKVTARLADRYSKEGAKLEALLDRIRSKDSGP